jgi:hypothetical protein
MNYRTHEFNDDDKRDLLERSVGSKMTNRIGDVQKIEVLLDKAGYRPFDPENGPTGMSGPVLDRAVMDFQRDNGLKKDGLVYTDGPTIKALAQQGRRGDTEIGHLTPGEMVIPKRVMTLELRRELDRAFAENGLDQGRYTVGGKDDSINPKTGMREFADPWEKLTEWHFENRDMLNNSHQAGLNQLTKDGSGWQELPAWQNTYHQNGVGKPERKFVHKDGQEQIYDGDTGELITDPQLRGTYNYINPRNGDRSIENPKDLLDYMGRFVGHGVTDVIPWWKLGNHRE